MTFPNDPLDAAAVPARPSAPAQAARRNWVPIRALASRHRPQILAHLRALGDHDRHLRFGHVAGDGQIGHYVDQIDFDRDEVFGIFNRRLEVVAMAHLAGLGPAEQVSGTAEFGVSVLASARGRGWGSRLFERAVLHARNQGITTLLIHALAENTAMLHIVRQAGAQVEFDGTDATARLTLPPEDLASHVEALIEGQAAEFDYGLKVQAQQFDAWLQTLCQGTSAHTQPRGAGLKAGGSGIPPPV